MPVIMQITVHHSLNILRELYCSRLPPQERFRRAGPLLLDPGTAIQPFYRARASHGRDWPALDVMAVAGCDGLEAGRGSQVWGLFNPQRSLEAAAWEFAQYDAVELHARARQVLAQLAQSLALPDATVDCLLLPCDSASRSLMVFSHGLSVYGAAPGLVLLRLWPCAGNLARLPAALARAWAQTLRHLAFGRETLQSLADFLVMEGIAAALVARCQPDEPVPWLSSLAAPPGWEGELGRIAREYYGVADYSDLVTNLYGAQVVMGGERPPPARALDGETLALTIAELGDSLDARHAHAIASALYGDEVLAQGGHPPAGIPAWAGFEVAFRLVEAWLRETGATLAEALLTPTERLVRESRLFARPL